MGNYMYCGGCIIPNIKTQEVNVEKKDIQTITNNEVVNSSENMMGSIINVVNGNTTKDEQNVIILKSMSDKEQIEKKNLEGGLVLNIEKFKAGKKNEINIVLIGEKQSGKTTFVRKFLNKKFDKDYIPTIGIDKNSKKVYYEKEEFKLNFTEPFIDNNNKINENDLLFKECDFFLIFYDITVPDSFDKAKSFLSDFLSPYIKEYKDKYITNFLFVGTKLDIPLREQSIDVVKNYCSRNNFFFIEISSKINKGINELIKTIIVYYKELLNDDTTAKNNV